MKATPTRAVSALLLVATAAGSARAQAPVYVRYGVNDKLGLSVATLGDLDGDGRSDFAAGNWPGFLSQRVRIYSAGTGSVIRELVLSASSGHGVDVIVAAAGDVNGDGVPDVLVGDPSNDVMGFGAGKVWVYSGADGAVIHAIPGTTSNGYLGAGVASLGDVDLDGRPDFASGFNDAGGVGSIRVWSGATGALLHTIGGGFNRVRGIGDVNGDGRCEILASSPSSAGLGRVRVLSGLDASTLFELRSDIAGDAFGFDFDGVGDSDGDGVPDIAVGAQFADLQGTDSGAVYCFSGANGALIRTIAGEAGRKLGRIVARLGDTDADGVDDFAAVDARQAGYNASTVIAFSGATGAELFAVRARYPSGTFDVSVGAAGDVNGDGRADVLVGDPIAWNAEAGPSSPLHGSVTVHLAGWDSPEVECVAKTNSLGCIPAISFEGAPSLSIGDGSFTIVARNVIAHTNGLLFFGPNAASVPFAGGTLCVAGPSLRRTPIQNAGGAMGVVDCGGRFAFAFTHAVMASAGFAPGQRWHAQYYSRDGGFAPPTNVGLTDAVVFTVCP